MTLAAEPRHGRQRGLRRAPPCVEGAPDTLASARDAARRRRRRLSAMSVAHAHCRPCAALLALRPRRERTHSCWNAWRQRRLQSGRDQRTTAATSWLRASRGSIGSRFRRGRECERHRRVALLGLSGRDARDRGARRQRLRHAPHAHGTAGSTASSAPSARMPARRAIRRPQSRAPGSRGRTTSSTWERLPDLRTRAGQQRNVVLHPECRRIYAFYTRPQDGFIDAGSGGGIGWGLCDDIGRAECARSASSIRASITRSRK